MWALYVVFKYGYACRSWPCRLCSSVLPCLYKSWGSLKHCKKRHLLESRWAQTNTSATCEITEPTILGLQFNINIISKQGNRWLSWLGKRLILSKTWNPLWTFVSWYSQDKHEAICVTTCQVALPVSFHTEKWLQSLGVTSVAWVTCGSGDQFSNLVNCLIMMLRWGPSPWGVRT